VFLHRPKRCKLSKTQKLNEGIGKKESSGSDNAKKGGGEKARDPGSPNSRYNLPSLKPNERNQNSLRSRNRAMHEKEGKIKKKRKKSVSWSKAQRGRGQQLGLNTGEKIKNGLPFARNGHGRVVKAQVWNLRLKGTACRGWARQG